jgi:hypothetical protein
MMKNLKTIAYLSFLLLLFSCKKEKPSPGTDDGYTYYQVAFKSSTANWRDTAFVVRTNNQQLIQKIDLQLNLPVSQRQLVVGRLVQGNGGFNKNASHEFKWHFKEDDWQLADVVVELYDGKPYTDVDLNFDYWMNTVKRFGAWSSFIRKKLPGKP